MFMNTILQFSGLMISSIAPTVQVALSVTAPLLLPLVLFGGFFMIDGWVYVFLLLLYMYLSSNLFSAGR